MNPKYPVYIISKGRWPANLITDGSEEVLEGFPDTKPSHIGKPRGTFKKGMFANSDFNKVGTEHEDSGSAARFFYCAKVSPSERSMGLENNNSHPTLKPIALTEYLARLILPPAEYAPRRILIPFSGAGSEMIGAHNAGWEEIVGIELSEEYTRIAEARLKHWTSLPRQMTLE